MGNVHGGKGYGADTSCTLKGLAAADGLRSYYSRKYPVQDDVDDQKWKNPIWVRY